MTRSLNDLYLSCILVLSDKLYDLIVSVMQDGLGCSRLRRVFFSRDESFFLDRDGNIYTPLLFLSSVSFSMRGLRLTILVVLLLDQNC